MRLTRSLVIAVAMTAWFIAGWGTAGAVPGHTSCKGFGGATAEAAHTGVLVPEIRSLAPGFVDDVIALVQVGGEVDGVTVAPLCTPK